MSDWICALYHRASPVDGGFEKMMMPVTYAVLNTRPWADRPRWNRLDAGYWKRGIHFVNDSVSDGFEVLSRCLMDPCILGVMLHTIQPFFFLLKCKFSCLTRSFHRIFKFNFVYCIHVHVMHKNLQFTGGKTIKDMTMGTIVKKYSFSELLPTSAVGRNNNNNNLYPTVGDTQ